MTDVKKWAIGRLLPALCSFSNAVPLTQFFTNGCVSGGKIALFESLQFFQGTKMHVMQRLDIYFFRNWCNV